MRKIVLIALLLTSITALILNYSIPDWSGVPDFYAKNIRASFFTGFLTVSSFLLSLKTFIIVKLKENIFDSKQYKELVSSRRKLNNDLTLYGPIRRLSNLVFITICACISASISQLTIGLIDHWVASIFCLLLAIFAICMLVETLMVIKGTIKDWLDSSEEAFNADEQKKAKEESQEA